MSELRTNVFFRPWHMPENEASGIVTVDNTLDSVPYSKQEDDNESVVSSTTSTASTVSTIVEIPEKYDDCLSDQDTADSTSSDVARCTRMRRRGSESSDDVATSTTPSFEDVESSVQGATNRSRVFRSRRRSADAKISRDSREYNGSTDACSLKYLSSLHELPRTSENFASRGERTYSMAVASTDVAGPSSVAHSMIPELYYGFPEFHPGIHPGVHPGIHPGVQSGIHPGIQPGIHPAILPAGFYTRSMEEAVQMVHRQDAAVKQMKKMRPKKFRCQYCDVAFSNNGQLKGHVRIHTGERPFKCDVESCGKSFTRNEELTRHKRIHTGVRPHSCVVCGKRFGRKDHLKKHTRTHEVRDPYRLSAAALDMLALSHPFQQAAGLAPYVYQI
ncbi:hypothetical protein DMN91_002237 [Ooceraea biroi]|uniref:C2H2-type domain-containing protein n=3 Tax=Ooceraea biroi TaxID=2015173 RepID=A0A3L8E048_OOCBI|nr:hypothetical protein DMN91_002237 [Ooceraea biroi]